MMEQSRGHTLSVGVRCSAQVCRDLSFAGGEGSKLGRRHAGAGLLLVHDLEHLGPQLCLDVAQDACLLQRHFHQLLELVDLRSVHPLQRLSTCPPLRSSLVQNPYPSCRFIITAWSPLLE